MAENSPNPGLQLLTESDRSYLRLVEAGLTSKEIALRVGDPPATIDTRLVQAARILGVRGRHAAAAVLAQHEALVRNSDEAAALPIAPVDGATELPTDGAAARQPTVAEWLTGWLRTRPVATGERPYNDLTAGQRTAWILAIAFLTIVFIAGLAPGGVTLLSDVWRLIEANRHIFIRSQ